MDRLGDEKKFVKETSEHLESFAQDGLRTLCFAYRELAEEEYQVRPIKHGWETGSVMLFSIRAGMGGKVSSSINDDQ